MVVSKTGDHVCLVYKSSEEKWGRVSEFIKIGIERKEKIVYITDDASSVQTKEIIVALNEPDTTRALADGQLVILRAEDTYYKNGEFDPIVMHNLIKATESEALTQGYSGVRGCGDMSWMFDDIPGSDQLIEYERELSQFLQHRKVSLLCLYDQNKFGREMTDLMERIHAKN